MLIRLFIDEWNTLTKDEFLGYTTSLCENWLPLLDRDSGVASELPDVHLISNIYHTDERDTGDVFMIVK